MTDPPDAAGQGPPPPPGPVPDPLATLELEHRVIEALSLVYDPEIPVNIYELGLIYGIVVDADRRVHVRMTLTSPACPAAQHIPAEVQARVRAIDGVRDAVVEIAWEPPWTPDRMSEAGRLQLGLF